MLAEQTTKDALNSIVLDGLSFTSSGNKKQPKDRATKLGEQFEAKIKEMSAYQLKCEGCLSFRYIKRFYTIDGIELGEPPIELTKIVKCVKYYSYWEFDTKENYGKAIKIFFENYNKDLQKLLVAPFNINLGYSI